MKKKNQSHGPTLESFLEEEGILEEVRLNVLKATIAHELEKAISKSHLSKTDFAKKMGTTRLEA